MNRYISEIRINKLYHLSDITISLGDDAAPHLILTGKNGSGKTVLLQAMADFLDNIKDDTSRGFLQYPQLIEEAAADVAHYPEGSEKQREAAVILEGYRRSYDSIIGKVNLKFTDGYRFIDEYSHGNFIIAFYKASRKSEITEPKSPQQPNLTSRGKADHNLTPELLKFLSHIYIQEALSRSGGQTGHADTIRRWIDKFEGILKRFYEDPELRIAFNYLDYTFLIHTGGKSFKFTEMADGFTAILEIVADLAMKMQAEGPLSENFDKPGIVLIDEIETHLHLKLQKIILPALTEIFPKLQFIVSSHSPFVLSSLPTATAYDMERHKPIGNLAEYSYQALVEGYFGLSTDSDYSLLRYNELKRLLEKEELTAAERLTARHILEEYRKIPEFYSTEIVGAFRNLEIIHHDRIKQLTGR
jgi:predicted ATPase